MGIKINKRDFCKGLVSQFVIHKTACVGGRLPKGGTLKRGHTRYTQLLLIKEKKKKI